MTEEALRSIPGVCDVHHLCGASADPLAAPDVLIETPHGATRGTHFDALAAQLEGPFPDDLKDFFFVNTDVASPELADRIAERIVAAHPSRSVLTIRSLIPRTFVDCNRVIDGTEACADGVTPGLPPYVRSPRDRALLVGLRAQYDEVVSRAIARICRAGGTSVMLHTYAPRSVDVSVDDAIVRKLHAAYADDVVETWPLRHEVDLITRNGDGRLMADRRLLAHIHSGFARRGITPAENAAYHLHPATSAAHFSARYPGRAICLEVRRDLLVSAFTPFAEMEVDPERVDAFAAILADAMLARWAEAAQAA